MAPMAQGRGTRRDDYGRPPAARGLARKTTVVGGLTSGAFMNWILDKGVWNDAHIWVDESVWEDS